MELGMWGTCSLVESEGCDSGESVIGDEWGRHSDGE